MDKQLAQKRGPAGLSYYAKNNNSTWQAVKKIKSGPKKCKAHHYTKHEAQLLNGAKNQRKAHMKGQETQTESLQVTADA